MSALIYYMLVPLINNNIMGLITINCLSDAATLTGDESFLLYQKNQTLKTSTSSLKPLTNCFEGFNNSAVCDPQITGSGTSGIIGGCNHSLSGCNSGILFGATNSINNNGGQFPIHSVIVGGLGNEICDGVSSGGIFASQNSTLADSPGFNALIGTNCSSISGAQNAFNFIAGGARNIIACESSGYYTSCSSIIGGTLNRAYGISNTIIGSNSSKTGACAKTCNSSFYGINALVAGGGKMGTLGLGGGNEARAGWSSVVNGTANIVCGLGGTILGGCSNAIQRQAGGLSTNLQLGGSILGGNNNTILAGHENSSIIGGTCMSTVSSNMLHTNTLFLSADLLPTTNPNQKGVVWNDSGTLKISLSTL